MVQLVDIDGDPVPDCERYTPTCPPDLEDPSDWGPEWDNWTWSPTDPFAGIDQADVDAAAVALKDLETLPIAGGAPDHKYSDQDPAAHVAWLQDPDGFYPPDAQVEPARPDRHSPDAL